MTSKKVRECLTEKTAKSNHSGVIGSIVVVIILVLLIFVANAAVGHEPSQVLETIKNDILKIWEAITS
jgi:predicted metalloprotease